MGGFLEEKEEGWLVTDLLGFEGPLCGLLQRGRPLQTRRTERAGSSEGAGTLAPAAGSTGRAPAHTFRSHRPDVPCRGAFGL